jgi:hypothetical protein
MYCGNGAGLLLIPEYRRVPTPHTIVLYPWCPISFAILPFPSSFLSLFPYMLCPALNVLPLQHFASQYRKWDHWDVLDLWRVTGLWQLPNLWQHQHQCLQWRGECLGWGIVDGGGDMLSFMFQATHGSFSLLIVVFVVWMPWKLLMVISILKGGYTDKHTPREHNSHIANLQGSVHAMYDKAMQLKTDNSRHISRLWEEVKGAAGSCFLYSMLHLVVG